ncbi:MAG TPA: DUF1259 domain-containing protein [Acidiferrobacterales bacterium]|nr:DUF1259 domain-containing protein [Acidiferrobacterales bacterium]
MKRFNLILASAGFAVGLSTAALTADNDWAPVAEALGRSGAQMPGGVYRVGLGRSDLKVTLDGVEIKPPLALGSYLAFQKMGGEGMVMGDLVLTQEEVSPVMKKLIDGGIAITAVHNHLLRSSPATMYMHFLGRGDPAKLAAVLRTALAESKTPLAAPAPAGSPPPLDLDTAAIDQTLGAKGTVNGGVYQFNIPRAETIMEGGMPIPVAMGSGIVINFQPTGGGKAAITGDFVLIAREVNPVLKTLRDGGIEVTALHSHMLDEQPRLFFMHFWANDDAGRLARSLKAALSKIDLAKS